MMSDGPKKLVQSGQSMLSKMATSSENQNSVLDVDLVYSLQFTLTASLAEGVATQKKSNDFFIHPYEGLIGPGCRLPSSSRPVSRSVHLGRP